MSAQTAARYEPRSAQTGVLFEVVAEHLAEFLESAQDPDEDEPSIPAFVEKAFRRFLACGDPQRGFIRLFCDRCQFEHPLAFSCKGRAICPSCAARRTEETVGHLMEHVLPDVPIRQYVLSPPFELRGLLAARSEVLSKLARIFVRAIFARMQRWAKATGLSEPRCGAVTFIQRFTKTLTIAPHLHVVVLDGVFADANADTDADADAGEARPFMPCPPPTEEELRDIARGVFERMTRYLRRQGLIDEDAQIALTPTDRWFLRSLREPSGLRPVVGHVRSSGAGVEVGGFSVHAGVAVARGDTRGRAQLCRYVARPPFAEAQLARRGDGRIELTLRSRARNGQRSITLEPLALMRRLAWLVPPPGQHQVRYAGVLAAAAKGRRSIVPGPSATVQLALPTCDLRPLRQRFRPSWAKLLAKVYKVDAERCPRCGGRLRPIGAITDPDEADRALARLAHRGIRVRDPPQASFAFAR